MKYEQEVLKEKEGRRGGERLRKDAVLRKTTNTIVEMLWGHCENERRGESESKRRDQERERER